MKKIRKKRRKEKEKQIQMVNYAHRKTITKLPEKNKQMEAFIMYKLPKMQMTLNGPKRQKQAN